MAKKHDVNVDAAIESCLMILRQLMIKKYSQTEANFTKEFNKGINDFYKFLLEQDVKFQIVYQAEMKIDWRNLLTKAYRKRKVLCEDAFKGYISVFIRLSKESFRLKLTKREIDLIVSGYSETERVGPAASAEYVTGKIFGNTTRTIQRRALELKRKQSFWKSVNLDLPYIDLLTVFLKDFCIKNNDELVARIVHHLLHQVGGNI